MVVFRPCPCCHKAIDFLNAEVLDETNASVPRGRSKLQKGKFLDEANPCTSILDGSNCKTATWSTQAYTKKDYVRRVLDIEPSAELTCLHGNFSGRDKTVRHTFGGVSGEILYYQDRNSS